MRIRLKDAFDLQMGKTPARNTPSYWDGDHKWISIADIGSAGKYIATTKERITDKAITESGIRAVPAHTVIMSFKLSIGKTAITSEEMYTNEAIMAFVSKGTYDIDADYLYHLCCGTEWTEGTNKAVMGLTLNKATLSEKRISLPEITEQRNIAAKFDALDNVIEKTQSELSSLDQLVKSRFVEMFGDPVSNPHGFEQVALSQLAEIKIGPFGSLLHKEDYIEGGHPLLNPSHISEGRIVPDDKLTVSDSKYAEMEAYHLHTGDIVMGRRGEMGRCAVVPDEGYLCGTGSLLIRTKGEVTADYLQKVISFPTFKKTIEDMAVGQTMPNLNVPIVSSFQIIKPPIDVQRRYYAFVAEVDKSKFRIQKSLSTSRKLWTMAQIDAIMNMDFSTQRSL